MAERNKAGGDSGLAGKTLLAGIGAGALKSIMVDTPKGAIERVTESAVHNKMHGSRMFENVTPKMLAKTLAQGGGARVAGGVLGGSLTFPVFVSGVRDIKNDERGKGYAKAMGAGLAYGMLKGGIQNAISPPIGMNGVKAAGKASRLASAWGGFKSGASSKAIPSLLAAAATGYAMAKGSKMQDKKAAGDRGSRSWILPVVSAGAGGGIAAAKEFPSIVALRSSPASGIGGRLAAYKDVIRRPKLWVPRVSGVATGGVLGGAVAGMLMAKMMNNSNKTNRGA